MERHCIFYNRLVHSDRKQVSVYEWLPALGMNMGFPMEVIKNILELDGDDNYTAMYTAL